MRAGVFLVFDPPLRPRAVILFAPDAVWPALRRVARRVERPWTLRRYGVCVPWRSVVARPAEPPGELPLLAESPGELARAVADRVAVALESEELAVEAARAIEAAARAAEERLSRWSPPAAARARALAVLPRASPALRRMLRAARVVASDAGVVVRAFRGGALLVTVGSTAHVLLRPAGGEELLRAAAELGGHELRVAVEALGEAARVAREAARRGVAGAEAAAAALERAVGLLRLVA